MVDLRYADIAEELVSSSLNIEEMIVQGGARKSGLPSHRPTWVYVSDSVQEIKQVQMQSTYWLEKVLKMIRYINALLCMLQHIVIHAMQLSGVNSPNLPKCATLYFKLCYIFN